jgi:subtilisin-like proprotein convertase family protein
MKRSSRWLSVRVSSLLLASCLSTGAANAGDKVWSPADTLPDGVPAARPLSGAKYTLDLDALRSDLLAAPLESTGLPPVTISLPGPDGELLRFHVVESPIMAPELAAHLPRLRTYAAQGIDDPAMSARFDVHDDGVRALVLAESGDFMIWPFNRDDAAGHVVYLTDAYGGIGDAGCQVFENPNHRDADVTPGSLARSGPTRRTFRLAVSATGEFTANNGGTQATGQAAVVSLVNLVNAVYEREFAVRLTLVANNINLIYTDGATDPFTNTSASTMLGENISTVGSIIGNANFDVGHVLGSGGGSGVAYRPAICDNSVKAGGVSLVRATLSDPFNLFLMAHELGHQHGANHTFNGNASSNCQNNRSSNGAIEPGSGSTIMSYAGICSPDNVVSVGDAYFHVKSFDEVLSTLASVTCGTTAATGNIAPTVNAGSDFTIPINTPFTLTGSGSDPNGDALTYRWEQFDQGPAISLLGTDNGLSPILRSRPATSSPSRTFPALADILTNTQAPGEELPLIGRIMRMRLTALDNRAAGGGRNDDEAIITVANVAGPFRVTFPNAPGLSLAGQRTVTWNVANTTAFPVSTANVRILLSTDGGNTYPTTLLSSTPNDGSERVTLPNINTTTARIRVEAVGNIYFDISDANFTIRPNPAGAFYEQGTLIPTAVIDTTGTGNNNGQLDPGETGIELRVPLVNTGSTDGNPVNGTLTSLTPTVTVVDNSASYVFIAAGNTINHPASPYILDVSPSHPCGSPINLRLAVSSPQGSNTFDFSLPTGNAPVVNAPVSFSYSGPAQAIPDGSPGSLLLVPLNVTGLSGTIADVDVALTGSSCNANPGSTTVGLDHTYVSDLSVSVSHPDGTIVQLALRPGGFGNNGVNFCSTRFDDEAAPTNTIQGILPTGAPYSNSYTPNAVLSQLDGKSPNGTWNLRLRDWGTGDSGSIRAFTITIRTVGSPTCTPPAIPCPCTADFDNSGGTPDAGDIDAFFDAWLAGNASADADCSGGTPDAGDVDTFFGQWLNGGC